MRAFVRLRQVLAQHEDLAKRIDGLEVQLGKHQGENEHHFRIVFEAIRRLIDDEDKESVAGRIGFETNYSKSVLKQMGIVKIIGKLLA